MPRRIQAGIDIGSHRTRVVVAAMGHRKSAPDIVATASVPSRGVRNGYITSRSEAAAGIADALAAAEKASGEKIRKVTVGIGGITLESAVSNSSVIISRADNEVTDTDINRVIQATEGNLNLANRKIIHRFPLAYKLDGKDVLGQPHGMRGVKLEARMLFITSLAQHIDELIAAVEQTRREVEDVVAAPLAASIATLSRPQQTAGCVLADIGAETVSIAVFENEQLISLHVFQIGSTNITNDIALGLKIPLEEAEEVKIQSFTGAPPFASEEPQRKQLEEIVEARLRDIFELIRAHLKKNGKDGLLPAGIILTGGGLLEIATVEDIAKAALGLPARVIVPRHLPHAKNQPLDTAWSVSAGICLLGFDPTYSSEIFQNQQTSVSNYTRRALAWAKQFLP